MRLLLILAIALMMEGCGTAPIVRKIDTGQEALPKPVEKLAVTGTASIKDKLTFGLALKGFKVVDSKPFAELESKYNINKENLVVTYDMGLLKNDGVGAIITISSDWSEHGKRSIESAYIKVINTESGQVFCGIEYKNGFNGMPGSRADYAAKESIDNSSEKIIENLLHCITPKISK